MEERGGNNHRSSSDWVEYRRMVLAELERIGDDITTIYAKIERIRTDDLPQIKQDVVLLKFQAAMWGALGGSVLSVGVAVVMKMLFR